MTQEGHICCLYMYGSSMVIKSCSLLFFFNLYVETVCTTVVVEWDIYMQCGIYICSGAYTYNGKSMYTSTSGHIVDFSEFT